MSFRSNRGNIPQVDSPLLNWAQNASSKITPAPLSYGLTAAIATSLATATSNFEAALAACDPFSRNKTATIAKQAAKAALLTVCRDVVKLAEGAAAVTDEKRSEIGIAPRKTPTPIPAPTVAPKIDILSVNGRTVTLHIHGDDENRRGKPIGCASAQIYSFVGAQPPEDPSLYKFEGSTTVTTVPVDFPLSVPAGSRVWFKACWLSPRNQAGPACEAVPAILQYGSTSMAA